MYMPIYLDYKMSRAGYMARLETFGAIPSSKKKLDLGEAYHLFDDIRGEVNSAR